MTITLNGTATSEHESPLSVADLLNYLGFSGQPVLVELNEVALRPREFPDTMINDGAKIELIRVAAGG